MANDQRDKGGERVSVARRSQGGLHLAVDALFFDDDEHGRGKERDSRATHAVRHYYRASKNFVWKSEKNLLWQGGWPPGRPRHFSTAFYKRSTLILLESKVRVLPAGALMRGAGRDGVTFLERFASLFARTRLMRVEEHVRCIIVAHMLKIILHPL